MSRWPKAWWRDKRVSGQPCVKMLRKSQPELDPMAPGSEAEVCSVELGRLGHHQLRLPHAHPWMSDMIAPSLCSLICEMVMITVLILYGLLRGSIEVLGESGTELDLKKHSSFTEAERLS